MKRSLLGQSVLHQNTSLSHQLECLYVHIHRSCAMKRPAPWALEQPVESRPTVESVDRSETDITSIEVMPRSRSESQEAMQNEHVPLLAECTQERLCSALNEATVASGWTPAYLRWWQEQVREPIPGLFAVRLIGDASSPGLFSSVGLDHLAFCRCVK